MKRNSILAVILLALTLVVGGGMGCSSSSTGGGSSFSPALVDVALGDFNESQVYLFLDFFGLIDAQDYNRADAILDDPCLSQVNEIRFHNGDLYVADTSNNNICIWRDYLNLTDSAPVDATLGSVTGLVNNPHRIFFFNDILITADDDGIFLFDNASSITGTDTTAPNVVLTNNGVTFGDAMDVIVDSNGRLFATNSNSTTAGNPQVLIYNDVQGVSDGGVDNGADEVLNEDTSFMGVPSTSSSAPKRLMIVNDILYVGTGAEDQNAEVFVFNNASTLATDALPDAVLVGGNALFFNTTAMVSVDPGSRNLMMLGSGWAEGACNEGNDSTMVGWSNVGNLINGQTPDVVIGSEFGMWHVQRMRSAGGSLFVSGYANCDFDPGILYVWLDAASIQTGQKPDIILSGIESGSWVDGVYPFSSSQGLEAIVRGQDTLVDLGT